MPHELVKAYGHLYPAGAPAFKAVRAVLHSWNMDEGAVELEGDLLRISYEGIFFPADDVMDALRPLLTPASQGKLDLLDIENWALHRQLINGLMVTSFSAGLNQVLEYSGH